MITKDQITAALRKLGPSTPKALAAELGCSKDALMYHARAMVADKTLQQAGSRMKRIVALPEQEIGTAPTPPQHRKPSRNKKGGGAGSRKAHAPKARAARPAEPTFMAAIDADCRLVCVNGSGAPVVYTPVQTERIATLLFQHFKA